MNIKKLLSSFFTLGLLISIGAKAEPLVSIYETESKINPQTGERIETSILNTKGKLGTGHLIEAARTKDGRYVRVVIEGIGNDAYILVHESNAKELLDLINSSELEELKLERPRRAGDLTPDFMKSNSGKFSVFDVSFRMKNGKEILLTDLLIEQKLKAEGAARLQALKAEGKKPASTAPKAKTSHTK